MIPEALFVLCFIINEKVCFVKRDFGKKKQKNKHFSKIQTILSFIVLISGEKRYSIEREVTVPPRPWRWRDRVHD